MGSNIWPFKLIFCPEVEVKKCIIPNFLENIILITRIWRKSVFRVWRLSTLVPIKMSVSSLTELHTTCQTLSFSNVSKEQYLFKSVTRLNPVFQPILTVTIVIVNKGWNTGFSPVTDLNKGCSLLRMLKLNVCQGVCSYVRLDTDIYIWTSVLNWKTLKTLFSPNSSNQKKKFQENWVVYIFLLYLCAKYELIWSDITAQTVSLGANLLVKAHTIPQNAKCLLFFWPKVAFTQDFEED